VGEEHVVVREPVEVHLGQLVGDAHEHVIDVLVPIT